MEITDLKLFAAKQSEIINNNYLPGYDIEKRILHAAVKSNEELGELCDVVLKGLGAQRSKKLEDFNKGQIESEIADVVFSVSVLAHLMEIDIEKAIEDKMRVINSRYDKNGKELS